MPIPTTTSDADEAAAAWRARLSSDDVSAGDRAAFQRWRDVDPQNGRAWMRVEQAWALSGRLSEESEVRRMIADAAPSRASRAPVVAFGFGLAAMAAVAIVALPMAHSSKQAAVTGSAASVVWTGTGDASRDLAMSDGSHVTLRKGARFAPSRSPGRRGGELLSGEAAFDVAHDTAHPFVITARGRSVTALGTIFFVRAGDDDVRVVLRRGSVRVQSPSHSVLLRPGEGLTTPATGSWRIVELDPDRELAWTDPPIAFHHRPLSEIAMQMNARSKLRLELDPGLAALQVSGNFRKGDVRQLVQALTASGQATILAFDSNSVRLGENRKFN